MKQWETVEKNYIRDLKAKTEKFVDKLPAKVYIR